MTRPLFHRFPAFNFFTPRGWRWIGCLTLCAIVAAVYFTGA